MTAKDTSAGAASGAGPTSDLSRVIALSNDKGGVGKTSLCANMAGQSAAAGYRVLAVDLNRQANLAEDLGYRGNPDVDDEGMGLLSAMMTGQPLRIVRGVRENLDVVTGGIHLTELTSMLMSRVGQRGRDAFAVLADALRPVVGPYDLVVIDTPPENVTLTDLALCAARWVIIPTRSDRGGLVGMRLVAQRFELARHINPGVALMGVALFASGAGSTAIRSEVRAAVEDAFGGHSPMFAATIRYSERTARDCRERGLLAHELEVAAAAQPAWWQALREGRPPARMSRAVSSVAADYQTLTAEVLTLLAAEETARSAT